ncbi:siderophore iron transporter [Aspergillus costaricaensis CBS 115574]|uniref:Siderophore iron transporter n=1 Tax=Aspergillus costaricaensis CBS 115574 TaxID=1448317 RepID=A0ACD1IU95_9EURO|nr:siderophore iron transporter [Aspergillus costaricaensis CBS 115574]RAK94022.1 siderophore iron transporter [Aspergillus costaricaensis CBS 115574]
MNQKSSGELTATPVDLDELPAGYYCSKNFVGSLIAVCLMAISLYLGYVLPVNSLSAINADLGPDPSYSLISTVFTLISGVGLLLVGRLGDLFGRRYILIGGQLLGLIGAIVCATAKTVPTVIGGSVLCGLAAAVQLTFSFVIAELVPNRARPVVNAGIFITTLPFSAFGSLIADLFIANTARSWRWTYYLNIITCGLSIILLVLFYFPPGWDAKRGNESRVDGLKKFDYIGFLLYAGGLILVLLGLSWGGTSYAWHSAHVVAVLVIGFVCLLAFALYEIFVPLQQPLLPMSLLRNRGYAGAVCSALVGNMVYFSMSLLWPTAITALYTTDTIKTGWLSISTGTGVIVGEVAAGILMKPVGYTKYQLIITTLMITAFSGALASINQYRQAYGIAFTAIGGFWVGYLELITIIMCPLYCSPQDIGLASGFLGSAKQVAGTIATAIYVAILDNRIAVDLPRDVSATAVNAGLPSSSLTDLLEAVSAGTTAAYDAVPGMTASILGKVTEAVKTAYSQSFRTVFLASIAFGGLSVIAACFAEGVDARFTKDVAAKLGGVDGDGKGGSEEKLKDGGEV